MVESVVDPNLGRPRIVTLCGSTKFSEAYKAAQIEEALAGKIVLTVSGMNHSDPSMAARLTPEVKRRLDLLHLEKIKMSDEVLFLNVGGYIGESTQNEFLFALGHGKEIRFLEPENIPTFCKTWLDVASLPVLAQEIPPDKG